MSNESREVSLPLGSLDLPERGVVDLWLARPGDLPMQAGPEGEGRKERMARLRVRQQFLLRLLLGAYLDLPGKAVRLVRAAGGKPVLPPKLAATGLRFSLSHSGPWLLLGVARNDVLGVDIEVNRPMPRAGDLARRFFHPDEVRALAGVAQPALSGRFLRTWTAKEAMIKAAGTGLAGVVDQVVVRTEPDSRLLAVPDDWPEPVHWQLKALDLPEGLHGHVAALNPSFSVRLRQLEAPGL